MGSAARGFLLFLSYVYHLVLGLLMLGLSLVALLSGRHSLRLDLLPWEGAKLTYSLLALGLFALLSVFAAISTGRRILSGSAIKRSTSAKSGNGW